MIILGIDPGMAILGYGVVEVENHQMQVIDFGTVTTPAGMEMQNRLVNIYDGVVELIDRFKPDAIAVEELFFNKNVKTALAIGHARGVAVLAGAKKGIPLFEYTPLQVKQAVVGYGRADKNQVQQMVKMILGLRCIPKPDDAADALAICVCHAHSYGTQEKLIRE
ncbi:crossover junction endodeoxyribonuclease RuvC [Xylanivirga thermophila]|jgi:crossover junction endodeoxyribonuclease RuvC|uniref:crossover junction endodeoxyribonuclease RuvC n=1 Tax=Xylanivirga thermophila TaxID=2496273 RepID=UPI00101DD042|nr:crossover junction endodeoxyribonuclease RuvC [Xylanivirga thermophila]